MMANLLGGGRRKHVPLLGAGAFDANLVGERFLAPGYLFGIRGVLEAWHARSAAVMDFHVRAHVIEELLEPRILDRIRRLGGLRVKRCSLL